MDYYLEIFSHAFMRRAFTAGACIAITTPLIGVVIVLRRLSSIGDSLSHSSLAGIALGLVLGINPMVGAIAFSVLAVFGIEFFRKAFRRYSELANAVVLSAGIGLAAILSGFVKNTSSLNSFLFGSIVAIDDFEMIMVAVLSLLILLVFVLLYKQIFFITFDEECAEISGIKTKPLNMMFMLLTAVSVSLASRTVGALMISSLIVLPVACALILGKSFKSTVVLSVVFGLFFTMVGLYISFYADLVAGGTIVMLGVIVLLVLVCVRYPKLKIR